MTEQWRDIPGFIGRYQVSDEGRVMSLIKRLGTESRLLAYRLHKSGRPVVTLCRDGQSEKHFVHILVASAFLGPRPSGALIRHLDGNNKNNRALNLAYGSSRDNALDAVKHGTSNMVTGERNVAAKLSPDSIADIRKRLQHESIRSIARRYSVNEKTIRDIKNGVTWATPHPA